MRTRIYGVGSSAPQGVLTNKDLEKIVETSDEWISTRSGIRERHIADKNTTASDLAKIAAVNALESANLSADVIDGIIVGTVCPDYMFPSTACLLQDKIGARKGIFAYDFSAGCTGFIYGLAQADAMVKNRTARYVLVVGVEILTKILNWTDRGTCVLFGDGAGAVVVGPSSDDSGIIATYIAADGSLGNLLLQPAGGSAKPASPETVAKNLHTVVMYGNEVFKHAVRQMEDAALKSLELSGIPAEKIDFLIPHQANTRIIEAVAKRLKLPPERVIVTIDKYGNTSAASIPMALDYAVKNGKIQRGHHILLVAFGAGFTWGSAMIRW